MSSTPFRRQDDVSLMFAWGALVTAIVGVAVGATHFGTAAHHGNPGGACLILSAILAVGATATVLKLLKRKRTARRLSAFEDARLSPGQLSTKHDRGVTLGLHLFDVEADRIPDGERERFAWLDGRTIGPPDDPNADATAIVGIYQAADPLPLYGEVNERNRPFILSVMALAVWVMVVCTIALA